MHTSLKLGFILLFLLCFSLSAQHPLVGTWEMVSIKGRGVDGEKFSLDTTTAREIKVITPTHYMLIAHTIEDDSLIFNRTYVGTIRLEGNKYIETPMFSSLPIFDNVRSNFVWRIEGDHFIQSGTFTRPDGKTVTLDELVFRKVKTSKSYPENPALGAWNQLASEYTDFDGAQYAHTKETAHRFHIITPTHWMRISSKNGKFESAMMGTYTMVGGKTFPHVVYASFSMEEQPNVVMVETVKEGKLHVSGEMTSPQGKKFTWKDVFEKAD